MKRRESLEEDLRYLRTIESLSAREDGAFVTLILRVVRINSQLLKTYCTYRKVHNGLAASTIEAKKECKKNNVDIGVYIK